MSIKTGHLSINRNGWIIYGTVEVALYLVVRFTAKNADHPGTLSQIFFTVFIIGLVLAVMLGVATLLRQDRAQN